jgi:glutamate-1-semialdehyde aminotransferase
MTASHILFPIATLLRVASRIICLIVIASFVVFAVDQTGSASTQQQNELNGTPVAATAPTSTGALPPHESAVHRTLDEAAAKLTSPFSAITAGSPSQWAVRGVSTVMALLVYGLGFGYLARVIRVRV